MTIHTMLVKRKPIFVYCAEREYVRIRVWQYVIAHWTYRAVGSYGTLRYTWYYLLVYLLHQDQSRARLRQSENLRRHFR